MLEVNFPITCPKCSNEALSSLPAQIINRALLSDENLRLHSRCHHMDWQASSCEMEQIRQYLWVAQVGLQQAGADPTNPGGP
jgi:hypothetical protein